MNLKQYAEQHFSEEERLLRNCDYPDMATQQRQHDYFVPYLRNQMASFRSKRVSIPDSTLAFMKDGLLEHILQEDATGSDPISQGIDSFS